MSCSIAHRVEQPGCSAGYRRTAAAGPVGFNDDSGGYSVLSAMEGAVTDLAIPVDVGVLRPARDRGALDIADRVVAKIAGRAASEVAGVEVPNSGGLRDLVGTATPKVQADVDGTTAAVTIVVAIDYPLPVFDTAAEVRRQVTRRLADLAGIERVEVRVEVTELFVSRRRTGPRVV
jgi:uncharacterized alkaline shock family protein YloU